MIAVQSLYINIPDVSFPPRCAGDGKGDTLHGLSFAKSADTIGNTWYKADFFMWNYLKSRKHIRILEASLLIALCISLYAGLWARAGQQRLAGELVRLHVAAASDSEIDQAIKLKVRDSVLECLKPLLDGAQCIDEALEIIKNQLPSLERAARAALIAKGGRQDVSATIRVENFPTRVYGGFALPAGDYVSLNINLGEGSGRNWWCVIFPPLCLVATQDYKAFSDLSDRSSALIRTNDGRYVLKFRMIELFEGIRAVLS